MANLAVPDRAVLPDTIVARVVEHCVRTPERLCAVFDTPDGPVNLSYQKLDQGMRRYAAAFNDRRVAPGSSALIVLDHGPDLLYAFFGALFAGAVPSFLPPITRKQNPAHFWPAMGEVIARIGSGGLVISDDHWAELSAHADVTGFDRLSALTDTDDGTRGLEPYPSLPDDTAFVQFSSGTTRTKKGVALSHRAVLQQLTHYSDALDLTRQDLIASWLPLYHDMGLIACCLMPVVMGVPVVMIDPLDWVVRPERLFDVIERHRATLSWMPNFAFQHSVNMMPEGSDRDLSSMRAFINCSERCRPETHERFADHFSTSGVTPSHLQTCYAMAENVFAVTQTRLGAAPRSLSFQRVDDGTRQRMVLADGANGERMLSCGRVLEGVSARIVDGSRDVVCDGEVGEIAVSGHSCADGYVGQPDLTSARFEDGWYYTGDLGFMHDGELYVIGRADDLLILNGKNFYAHDLEFLLSEIDGALPGRLIALGVEDPSVGSQRLVVVAETDVTDPQVRKVLQRTIRQVLTRDADLGCSVQLVNRGWLIKSTSGKISRAATLARYRAQFLDEEAHALNA